MFRLRVALFDGLFLEVFQFMRGQLVINSISVTVDGCNPSLRKKAWVGEANVLSLIKNKKSLMQKRKWLFS